MAGKTNKMRAEEKFLIQIIKANRHMQDSFAKAEITHLHGKFSVTREDINKNVKIFQLKDYPLIQIQKQVDTKQSPEENLNELQRTEAFRGLIL